MFATATETWKSLTLVLRSVFSKHIFRRGGGGAVVAPRIINTEGHLTLNLLPVYYSYVAVNPSGRRCVNVRAIYRVNTRWRKARAENSMVTLRVW